MILDFIREDLRKEEARTIRMCVEAVRRNGGRHLEIVR